MSSFKLPEMRGVGGEEELIRPPSLSQETQRLLEEVRLPPFLRKASPSCGLVEIAGRTLAVGKTQAGKALEEVLGEQQEVVFCPERWQDNPYLQDPESGYQSEAWFLEAKAEDNARIARLPCKVLVVQDVPPELDYLYAAVDCALGRITQEEFLKYQEFFQQLAGEMVRPDLVVFLDCNLGEVFRRVRQRGREFEQAQGTRTVALAYLTGRFLQEGGWHKVGVLGIDSGRLNFNDDIEGKRKLARRVVAGLRQENPDKLSHLPDL